MHAALETGDIAVMDEKRLAEAGGPQKDLIVVSGFNVYPNEIEEVVASNDKESWKSPVSAWQARKTGEAIKVFVVRKDPSLTKEELIDFCRKELTAYKVPKDIEFRRRVAKIQRWQKSCAASCADI